MKLFAIYVGGELKGANIELHDMRFVVADTIAGTYEELRRQWWGIPSSLHIDCCAEIDNADGYDVTLSPEPFTGPQKLYYVNLGGYEPSEFLEKHKNVFVVAETVAEAKARAIKTVKHWVAPHRDEMYEAEQVFCLNESGREQFLHIHLTRNAEMKAPAFTCDYKPIAKR